MDDAVNPGGSFDPRILLSHAGGLRALACDLVGDAHAAEDILQDTFVRALVAPPPKGETLGAWLRHVARGFALNRMRNEAHRIERETRHARERAAREDDVDSEERGEVLRAVVEAVLALDEPYKATVLLRYFEGLSPSEIAARTKTPIASVSSRLQRAHRLLRERLERKIGPRHGGLAPALFVLIGSARAPIVVAPTLSTAVKGAVAVSTKTTVLVAAGLAACLLIWLWQRGDEITIDARNAQAGEPDPTSQRSSSSALLGDGVKTPEVSTAHEVGREAAKPRATEPEDTGSIRGDRLRAGPYEFDIEFAAFDARGGPISGAQIDAAPWGMPVNTLGTTAWDGRLRVKWRGFEREIELVAQASRFAFGESDLRRVVVRAGTAERVMLPLIPEKRAPIGSVYSLGIRLDLNRMRGNAVALRSSSKHPNRPEFELDRRGNGVFIDPFLTTQSGESAVPVFASLPLVGRTLRSQHFATPSVALLGGTVSRSSGEAGPQGESEEKYTAVLTGRMRSNDGRPAVNVPVALSAGTHAWRMDITTDEEGGFAFDRVPVGNALLSAGDAGHGLFAQSLVLEPGEKRVEGRLDERGTLSIHLTDETGMALAEWRVEAWTAAGERQFVSSANTDEQGRATLTSLEGGPFRLLARPNDGDLVPAVLLSEGVWLQDQELAFSIAGGHSRASLAVRLTAADGHALAEAQARLWRKDRLAGVDLALASQGEGADGRTLWRIDGLVAGAYFLEAGARGQPWTNLGPVVLHAGEKRDLGVHALDAPAEVDVRSHEVDVRLHEDGVRLHEDGVRLHEDGVPMDDGSERDRRATARQRDEDGLERYTAASATGGVAEGGAESEGERFEMRIELRRQGAIVRSPAFVLGLPARFPIPVGASVLTWTCPPLDSFEREAAPQRAPGFERSEKRQRLELSGAAGRVETIEIDQLPR